MSKNVDQAEKKVGSNANIAVLCLSLVAGMTGLAYASVPLYKLFCQVTGYGGTTKAVESADGINVPWRHPRRDAFLVAADECAGERRFAGLPRPPCRPVESHCDELPD